MRVALIAPSYDTEAYRHGESLGLRYLAAVLAAEGHAVDVYDLKLQRMREDEFLDAVALGKYMLIGFGVLFSRNLDKTVRLAERVRERCRSAHLCIGGQGTSFVWADILRSTPALDAAICFEAEETIVELATAVDDGSLRVSNVRGLYFRGARGPEFTGYRRPPVNLDLLPFPKRTDISRLGDQPHFLLLTSRGCTAHCTFCCSGSFGNKYHDRERWRPRSAANVLREVDQLVEVSGAKALSFVDDDFLGGDGQGIARATEIARELRRRDYPLTWSMECRADEVEASLFSDLRAAGLRNILIGIDAGNARDLRLFCKQTTLDQVRQAVQIVREIGLSLDCGFIMFHPLTRIEDIKENLSFLRDIAVGGYQVLTNRLELYEGSPLVRYFERNANLRRVGFMYDYEISEWRVRTFRGALRVGLRQLRELETRAEKIRFSAQSGLGVRMKDLATERQGDIERRVELLQGRIRDAQLSLAIHLVELVEKIESDHGGRLESLKREATTEGETRAAGLLGDVLVLEQQLGCTQGDAERAI